MRSILLVIVSMWLSITLSASHISGMNISYECVGGEDYLITVNLFRDCQDQNFLPGNLNVYIGSSCINLGWVELTQVDLIEVSQLCEEQLPNSTCNGGFQPGVQMGIYQAYVQLEPCIDWRIVVSHQSRQESIVNLVDPGLYSIHTEAFLNNSSNICNSSPVLSLLNLPSVCVGTELFYNLGFLESDGDSLSYALVNAQASEIDPNFPFDLDYVPPYSGAEPMIGMTIDPVNGQISVTPGTVGRFNAVVEVREYRNGNLIGIVRHDFLFLVNACPIPPPEPDLDSFTNVSGGGYPLDNNTIGICPEDEFCFEIAFTSVVPTLSVNLTSNINLLIPGATETVTGTNPATIEFCGTLPPDFAGGSFIITAIDDACPVYGQNFYTIDFAFREPIKAFGDTTMCAGETVQVSALNDTLYTWHSLAGDVFTPGVGISCNPCQSPFVTPDSATYYVVEGQYANSTCANRDTVFVDVPLSIDVLTSAETCTGNDGVIDINILTGSGNFQIVWDDIGAGPLSRNDLVAGTYSVEIFDDDYNCSRVETFTIVQLTPPESNAGPDFEVCGLTANLAAEPTYGIPSWNPVSGVGFDDLADENTSVTVPTEGVYEFVWNEDAGVGCVDSDTVQVTFYAEPVAEITAPDSVCGLLTGVHANVQNGTPQWTATAGLSFQDPTEVTTDITADTYGLTTLYLEVENGTCYAADTTTVLFIEQPVANAGDDVEVCGNEAEIAGIDGVGNGLWFLPPGVSTTSDLNDPDISISASGYGNFEITRTLVNLGFCTDSDTIQVRFTEIPVVDIGDDRSECDSLTLIGFTLPVGDLSWEVSPNLVDPGSAVSPQEITGFYGQHQAILHADNGYGCVDSDTLNINFVVQPQLESLLADTVCGLEYVLNADLAGDNHYWLQPDGTTISDLNNPNSDVIVSAEGDYTFYWIAENGGLCRDTSIVSVQFYDQPVSNAGEDLQICGLSADLYATVSYGDLVWEDLPGITFSDQFSPNTEVTADTYGTYAIPLQETNGICIDIDTVQVTFYAEPFVEILAPDSACGLVTGVVANITNGAPQWTATPGLIFDDPAAEITNITADSYGLTTLYLEVENGACYAADTTTVLFIEQPVANAGDDVEVCGNEAGITGVDGVGNGLWYLPPGVSTTSDLTDPSISISASGYGNFEITRTLVNLDFCTDSDTIQVRFTEIPVVDIGDDRNECDSLTLIDFTLPVGDLSWEVSPNLVDPGSAVSPQEITGFYGQHQAILHADNGYGCVDSDTLNINFVVQPQLESILADTVCGLEYVLNADPAGDSNYWLQPDGTAISDLNNPNSDVAASAEGDYTFYWIAENGGLCRDTSIVSVQFYDQPVSNAGEDLQICGLSADLNATISYGNLVWEDLPGLTFSNRFSPNTEVTADTYGTYIIPLQETNGICIDSDAVQVTFFAEAFAEIIVPDSVCGLVTGVAANITNGTPQWTATPGLSFQDPAGNNTNITADSYGLITLYLAIGNGACYAADTATVIFIEQPVTYVGDDLEVCGIEAELSAADGVGNGVWSLPEGVSTTSDLSDPDISISAPGYGNFEITRTLTNLDFCIDIDTIQVRFTEIPIVNIGEDRNECDSLTVVNFTLPVGDLYWEVSPNLVEPGSVNSPQEITGAFGQHQAILHADNGYGCVDSDTLNINFVVQPQLESLLADTVCGLAYELSADPVGDSNYWLQPGGVTISDLNNPNSDVIASTEGNYTFYWIAENGGLCRDTSIVPIQFYDQPVSNAGEDLQICGLSVGLQATASHGVLIWEDQPGLTFSNQLSPNAQVQADWYGTHIINLYEINGICTDFDSVKVEFISTPQILNPQWECTGTDAEFVLSFDVSLGDTANYEIQGLAGELNNFHFQSFPLSSETPVQVVLEDFGYCGGDTLTGTLFCPVVTNAGIMNPDTIRLCGDELVEALSSVDSYLDGNDTLLYAFHNGSEGELGTVYGWNDIPSFIFSDVLDFSETYFISAVAGNELDGGVDLNDPFLSVSPGTPVEFYELPYSEISGDITVCPYDTVFIPVNLSGDLPQEITYSFAGANHTVFADSYDFSLAIPDSGSVQLISTQSEACTGIVEGSVQLLYYRIPEVSISSPVELCEGDTAFIEMEFEGAQPFTGEVFQNGNFFLDINSNSDSLGFYTTQGGDFSVVNFSDQNCYFSDTVSTSINVKPMPEFTAGGDISVCAGDTILIGGEGVAGQFYNWHPNPHLLQTNQAQVEYAAVSYSPFPQFNQLLLTVERDGCFDTDTVLITVNPRPLPQIIGGGFICSGDSTWLIGYGGANYEWRPASLFSDPEGNTTQFSASANTVIELMSVSEAGCMAVVSTEIEVREKPEAVFGISRLSGCAPLNIKMTALATNPENTYNWNLTGISGLGNNSVANTSLAEAGTYTASLTVTAPNGCSQTEIMTENIEVFSTFSEFSFSPQSPDVNHPEVYFYNYSPEGVNSTWTVDSLVFGDDRNASYSFPQHIGGNYNVCLAVVDDNNCRARLCKLIKLKNDFEIYVPTAFTPNGDGVNDLFYPVLSNIDVVEYKFWITNPRGRIVFSTTDVNGKWDGGTVREDDSEYYGENKVYNWHLIAKPNFNVETTYFTGHVLLLR